MMGCWRKLKVKSGIFSLFNLSEQTKVACACSEQPYHSQRFHPNPSTFPLSSFDQKIYALAQPTFILYEHINSYALAQSILVLDDFSEPYTPYLTN